MIGPGVTLSPLSNFCYLAVTPPTHFTIVRNGNLIYDHTGPSECGGIDIKPNVPMQSDTTLSKGTILGIQELKKDHCTSAEW